jgi:hypothetical protein
MAQLSGGSRRFSRLLLTATGSLTMPRPAKSQAAAGVLVLAAVFVADGVAAR